MRRKLRRILSVFLLAVVILSEWLWWDSYKATVDWSKRQELFPLPFYIAKLPNWLIVDLAIALITFSALILTVLEVAEDA